MTIRNGRGEVRARVALTDGIHPGVVALPGKWWRFPEATGSVGNDLTPAAWSSGGQPAYNDTFVEVVPAGREARGPLHGRASSDRLPSRDRVVEP